MGVTRNSEGQFTLQHSCDVKACGAFSFQLDQNGGMRISGEPVAVSPCEKIKVYLNGVIYGLSRDQLVGGFFSSGAEYVKQLNGSFIIFLVEGVTLSIITDKVNSKKAFYFLHNGVWYISSNIDDLPTQEYAISLEGIACYLANGALLHDMTLFEGVGSVKRASIHRFDDGKLSINTYWTYGFSYSSEMIESEEEHQEKLKQLLIQGVARSCGSLPNKVISLSAGYDARGILGILHESLEAEGVNCFSYALDDEPPQNSDPFISGKLARHCGYFHRYVRSYDGDLVGWLSNNAAEGKCIANLCHERDAWHKLAAEEEITDVIVGDECFGWSDVVLNSKEEILDSVSITGAGGIENLKRFMSPSVYTKMCQCLKKLGDDIFESTSALEHPHDKKDFLYLDQRVNHVIMPWRDYFTGQAGFVHNPYLDGDILDFMRTLPPELRLSKKLFRKTIKSIVPNLFEIETATASGYLVNWSEEIDKNRDRLIRLVEETDSRLDEVLPKSEVIKMLKSRRRRWQNGLDFMVKSLEYLRRKNRFAAWVLSRLVGQRVKPGGRRIGFDTLLLRVLLIRIYLTPAS